MNYYRVWCARRTDRRLLGRRAKTTRYNFAAVDVLSRSSSDDAGREYVQRSGQRAGAVLGAAVLNEQICQGTDVLGGSGTGGVPASRPHVLQTRPALVVHGFGIRFVLWATR